MARLSARRMTAGNDAPAAPDLYMGSASPAMAQVLQQVGDVAVTDTTVLLTGETGTGKEVVARHIHALSTRARAPFVAINCGALPAQLIESELFGHERGAFSGALDRRIGHFEAAQGGTLLLDEVSEIPLTLQTRLLRVLQEREVQRIGSSRPQPIDVRIIATTNRDLRSMVARGELRKDLFYRLNVFPVALPPLRERKEDIAALAQAIIARLAPRLGREARATRLGEDALAALHGYDFPGNVRELANLIERALVMSRGEMITAGALGIDPTGNAGLIDLPTSVQPARVPSPSSELSTLPLRGASLALDEAERRLILEALTACRGNRTHASRHLGICVRTLRNKLRAMRDSGLTVPEPQGLYAVAQERGNS